MKVVHLVPAMEEGGVESVVLNLNRALVERGHKSLVISKGGKLVARLLTDGGRHIICDLKSKNPLSAVFRALALRKILKAEAPDLVCAHSRVPAWLFRIANWGMGLKWITYAHGANSVSAYSAIMTKGDLVVVPSKFLADYLKASYRFDDSKLRIVPNAVDTIRFDPTNLDREFIERKREEWGIKTGEKVLMAVGRITPIKGLDRVIESLGAGERLVIVGGADHDKQGYLEHLKAIARENVVFAGPQTRIPECISLADVVVSGNDTKPESFGLSIAEAFAMNKPVRARRFGGVGEIMEAVEGKIAVGEASNYREAVRKLYDFGIMCEKTLSVYEEVVNDSV